MSEIVCANDALTEYENIFVWIALTIHFVICVFCVPSGVIAGSNEKFNENANKNIERTTSFISRHRTFWGLISCGIVLNACMLWAIPSMPLNHYNVTLSLLCETMLYSFFYNLERRDV